jgi:D-alanine-D-alanine ligase
MLSNQVAGRNARTLVLVLHSDVPAHAPPDEQDTLVQAQAVGSALEAQGYRVATMAFTSDLAAALQALRRIEPGLVFNLVESVDGRGNTVHLAPALLAASGLAYTGCDSRAMLLSADKLTAKRIMAGCGIPTPPWYEPGAGAGPWIVKSVWEEASQGLDAGSIVSGCDCEAELRARARRFGGEWFAERYVEGREFNIALLETEAGVQVLPIAEMQFLGFPAHLPRIVDYAAKWDTASFAYRNTRRSFSFPHADTPLLDRLTVLAGRCWAVFGLRGYARVDVRVDAGGNPWVLELNANPCLAPDAGYAAAVARAGLNYSQLIGGIAERVLSAGLAAA